MKAASAAQHSMHSMAQHSKPQHTTAQLATEITAPACIGASAIQDIVPTLNAAMATVSAATTPNPVQISLRLYVLTGGASYTIENKVGFEFSDIDRDS